MESYYVETHRSLRKKQPRSTTRRLPVHNNLMVSAPAPAPAPAPAEEIPRKEPKKRPVPSPVPEWSKWQPIVGQQWDGYWRSKTREDGGWDYQFTKDFITIWEQKPACSEPSALAATSTKTAGEPVLLSGDAASALVSTTPSYHPIEPLSPASSSSSVIYTTDDDVVYASYADVDLSTPSYDLSTLTLEASSNQQEDRYMPTINTTATATNTTRKKKDSSRQYHTGDQRRKTHHVSHTKSKQAYRHPNNLGGVVSKEKSKKFDSKAIVDNWLWDC